MLTADSRTLGTEIFAAISAVEGIELCAESQERLSALRRSGLSLAQQRDAVLRLYSKKR